MQAKDFMTSPVVSVSEDSKVIEAAELMLEKSISILPVVSSTGDLVGVLTESDFLGKRVKVPHAMASLKQLFGKSYYFKDVEEIYGQVKDRPIKDVMTKDIKSIEASASLNDVVDYLVRTGIKRLPVMENQKMVGVITRKDILKAFLKA